MSFSITYPVPSFEWSITRRLTVQTVIWSIIGAICIFDLALLVRQGMDVTFKWSFFPFLAFLVAISWIYRERVPLISRLGNTGAQMVVFTKAGALMTYLMMDASPFPMADNFLGHADAAIGFDWLAWYNFVQSNPNFHLLLTAAYGSVPAQLVILIGYYTYSDQHRVNEYLLATILSILIITPIMFILPAIGAWSQHGVGIEPWYADIVSLRDHSLRTLGELQGIVSFPSFHTVLGVLLANMARRSKGFVISLFVNGLMIASVMSEGAHFGVDLISGLITAWIALRISQSILAHINR